MIDAASQKLSKTMNKSKKKVLVFASGAGSLFEYLAYQNSDSWQICGLITNKPHSGAVKISQNLGLKSRVCLRSEGSTEAQWDLQLTQAAQSFQPDFILLAGFLKRIGPLFLKEFRGRVLNTHPSLLPKYGGKGMYGSKIHAQVFANKDPETGVTIHWVDENYDTGQVIAQKSIDIKNMKSAEAIEATVKSVERDFLFQTLQSLCCEQNEIES